MPQRFGLLVVARWLLFAWVVLSAASARAVARSLSASPEEASAVRESSVNQSQEDQTEAKSPEASLNAIKVEPGFKVELAASEPLVRDPIAFDWGADGTLWVLEMGDYPLGLDGKGKPGGMVRVLEDSGGDGRYVKQSVFLDGLGFPSGLMPWRGGVLVACAPDIFFAQDTDGDGKADRREVLFTGFERGNQQHRLNGFELGLDGWVYGANGDSGGRIRSLKTGKTTVIGGQDFRFRPDTGEFEPESGQTQYGRHRDDWGRWYGNNNSVWAWQYVLASSRIKRNPYWASPDPRQMLEPATRLYPASRTVERFNDPNMANHVTSANSPTPYRDDLFGPSFASSLFVSEPVHNLVHRIVLEPKGASFQGKRSVHDAGREFIASTDTWFRPTMLKTGPDGALWIADMYRFVIEHPEWIPDDWEKRLDLRAGSQQGRIYRVHPLAAKPRPIPRLDRLDTAGLVAALDASGGWQRDTAQRLLLHRRDPTAIAHLRRLVAETKRPKTRVQAIWTLADLDGLDEPSALAGLTDLHAEVRESTISAVAPLLAAHPRLAEVVFRLADDADAHVRFQVAMALGDIPGADAGATLAAIARRDSADPWIRAAIFCSAVPHVAALVANLAGGENKIPRTMIEPLLAVAGALPDHQLQNALIRPLAEPAGRGGTYAPWQFDALVGLLEARSRQAARIDLDRSFRGLWEAARRLARDDSAGLSERIKAVRLLGHAAAREPADRDLLVGLLHPRVPIDLQQAAVAALGRTEDPKVADLLVHDWRMHSPQVRAAILDTLISRSDWTSSLLSSLEDGCIPPAEIDPARRQQLASRREPALKARARAVFAEQNRPRQGVVDSFRPVLAFEGDRIAGAAVFKKLCASCHRFGGEGIEVGPDLAALNDKSPESFLVAILDPSRAFETRYANFTVATVDGRVLNGLIAHESATAVTLRRQDGKEDVLLRSQIEEMAASGQSLMPEGLEKDLNARSLADLITYLASASPARKPE